MKIWIDAQMSPAIAAWINRNFEGITAESIRAVGLRDALDTEIFIQAKQHGVVVMSKDEDFVRLEKNVVHHRKLYGLHVAILQIRG